MRLSNSNNYGLEQVPKGFSSWIKLLESHSELEVSKEVISLLQENDPLSAIEIFEQETSYNPSKIWH